jgi:3-isopropylmalate dehydrogenase
MMMAKGDQFKIMILPGDGIGPEIMREAVRVLQTFTTPSRSFELQTELIGGASIDAYGDSLIDRVKEASLASDAVLFGSVGGSKWDSKRKGLEGPEGGLLRLRQAMNVYGNVRPCLIPSFKVAANKSPLKPELLSGVDFIVLRENVGGAYFGRKIENQDYG